MLASRLLEVYFCTISLGLLEGHSLRSKRSQTETYMDLHSVCQGVCRSGELNIGGYTGS
jgi:hypothetical protein